MSPSIALVAPRYAGRGQGSCHVTTPTIETGDVTFEASGPWSPSRS